MLAWYPRMEYKPSQPSCLSVWSRSWGRTSNEWCSQGTMVMTDLELWPQAGQRITQHICLNGSTSQEQMRCPQVTQSFPCHTASIHRAISQVSSLNSQACIGIHMAPILQMGCRNLISFIQGWDLPSKPGCRSSMHNATVPLRGSRAEVHTAQLWDSSSTFLPDETTKEQGKDQAVQPAKMEKQTKTIQKN